MTEDDEAMEEYIARHTAAYEELLRVARGQDVVVVEGLLRDFAGTYARHTPDIDLVLTARVMSDPRWARKHPFAAIALAWRYRDVRSPRRTLLWLWRPRFAG